MAWWTWRR